jgi:hypothetical protein
LVPQRKSPKKEIPRTIFHRKRLSKQIVLLKQPSLAEKMQLNLPPLPKMTYKTKLKLRSPVNKSPMSGTPSKRYEWNRSPDGGYLEKKKRNERRLEYWKNKVKDHQRSAKNSWNGNQEIEQLDSDYEP